MEKDNANAVVFEGVCRGRGKIYALLSVPEREGGHPLVAVSRTPSGNEVPAIVMDWESPCEKVLVLPILSVAQTCSLYAERDGNPVEVARRMFDPLTVRAESVVRSLRKDARFQLVRNCDANGARMGCEVSVDRVIPSASGDFIVHGNVRVTGLSEDGVAGDLELTLLDSRGADVGRDAWICMKDVIRKTGGDLRLVKRIIEFSVRLDAQVNALVVWAVIRNAVRPEGFVSLMPNTFADLLAAWAGLSFHAFNDGAYDEWFKLHHAATQVELLAQSRCTFDIEPLFSIVVPLYNTPIDLFCEMADSVLAQSYEAFELLLVNSTPENAELAAAIDRYTERDSRVKRIDLPENRGITENTNAGIEAATGDFVCFLDHDDLLTPDALYCYVRGINEYPETDLLYSDEDKVRDGLYLNPFFKPDWNPDLLTSMNYVCHFLCVRKSIIDELEPPTREYDGSQDHYLTLRASARARNIFHARRVLYHWRIIAGSTSEAGEAKPYTIEAGIRALQNYADEQGWNAKAQRNPRFPAGYEVVYELQSHPLVSIIIPNKDSSDMLDRCIRSIVDKSTYDNYEIVVIENNSTEQATFDYYEKLQSEVDSLTVEFYEGGFNYARINNFGATKAKGDFLLLLNNDTEVITPDWIERMLGLCMREDTGAVGARLLFADGTIQHAGVIATEDGPYHINRFCDGDSLGYCGLPAVRQDLSVVTAACLMTSRAAFEQIGGFDERFVVAYNDVDLCFALREAGYLVVYEPGAELYHHESISRGFDSSGAAAMRFNSEFGLLRQKWPRFFGAPDPYGNPNFRQDVTGAYHRGFSVVSR